MKYIISSLSKQNDFILDYQSPCLDKTSCATNLNDGIGIWLEKKICIMSVSNLSPSYGMLTMIFEPEKAVKKI